MIQKVFEQMGNRIKNKTEDLMGKIEAFDGEETCET